MVLMMKIFHWILFIIIALCFSCEEMPFIIECEECQTEEPIEATITISLSEDSNNTSTEVIVYEGLLEDNIIYTIIYSMTDFTEVVVPLNKRYTIIAYYSQGHNYRAVDSVVPRVRFDDQQCENPCYYVYDNTANLRLKRL